MKTVKITYGLTVCVLCLGLILIYISVQPPVPAKISPHLLKDSYRVTESSPAPDDQPKSSQNSSATVWRWQLTQSHQDVAVTSRQVEPTSPPTPTVSPLSRAHIVAIVSYMRSGSTLTADILQHFPGTLYVFEPLHTVFVRTRQKKPLVYLNGKSRKLKVSDLTPSFVADELNKWFTCRYADLDVHSLTDNFHTHYSRTMRKLSACWKPKKRTLASIRQCLPVAVEMCKKAKHLLFKFIRVPMHVIENVIQFYPRLQIIHLVRDPRGSMTSQIKVKKHSWNEVDTTSKQHCSQIEQDLGSTVRLYRKYPKRAKVLIYENVAETPITVAKRLYSFANLPRYKYIIDYVHRITQSGKKDGHAFTVVRANSTRTAYSWRDKIDLQHSLTVDKNCKAVYAFLGYQQLTNLQDIRNHLLSSHVQPDLPMII